MEQVVLEVICYVYVKEKRKKKPNIEKILRGKFIFFNFFIILFIASYLDTHFLKIKLDNMTIKKLISKYKKIISSNPTMLEKEVPSDKMHFDFQNKNINLVEELLGATDRLLIDAQLTLQIGAQTIPCVTN